jgi:hypothetical protein
MIVEAGGHSLGHCDKRAMLFSTPSSLSDPSLNTDEAHLSAMLRKDMSDLIPLTEETYPREIETKTPDQGYYIALGAILLVWMITPLSWCAPPLRSNVERLCLGTQRVSGLVHRVWKGYERAGRPHAHRLARCRLDNMQPSNPRCAIFTRPDSQILHFQETTHSTKTKNVRKDEA